MVKPLPPTVKTEFGPLLGEQTIIFRLANNHVEDYPTSLACDFFSQKVQELSNGKLVIENYHNGILGEETSVIEQAQFGGIDFIRVSISPLSEISSSLNALQLPYLYRDNDHMWKVLDGAIGNSFLKSMGDADLLGLGWYDGGARHFYNTKKPAKTPEDLVGMRIRVQESKLMSKMIENMGAIPEPMPFSDVYRGLQKGVIDGAENNWPSYMSTEHYEVAPFITLDGHTRVPEMLAASEIVLNMLPEESSKLFEEAAKLSSLYQREIWKKSEKEAEQAAKTAGVIITKIADITPFQNASKGLYEEGGMGAPYAKLVEDIKNVR